MALRSSLFVCLSAGRLFARLLFGFVKFFSKADGLQIKKISGEFRKSIDIITFNFIFVKFLEP